MLRVPLRRGHMKQAVITNGSSITRNVNHVIGRVTKQQSHRSHGTQPSAMGPNERRLSGQLTILVSSIRTRSGTHLQDTMTQDSLSFKAMYIVVLKRIFLVRHVNGIRLVTRNVHVVTLARVPTRRRNIIHNNKGLGHFANVTMTILDDSARIYGVLQQVNHLYVISIRHVILRLGTHLRKRICVQHGHMSHLFKSMPFNLNIVPTFGDGIIVRRSRDANVRHGLNAHVSYRHSKGVKRFGTIRRLTSTPVIHLGVKSHGQ